MHILIDARMAVSKKFGFGRYVYNLLEQFGRLAPRDRFTFLVRDDFLSGPAAAAGNASLYRTNLKWLSIVEQFALPGLIRKISPDVFFSPTFIAPVIQPRPTVISVHDLMHVVFSDHYSFVHKLYYGWVLRRALKKTKAVITKSESSKRDLIKYYGLPESKIVIVHDGVESHFQPVEDEDRISALKKKYGLPDNFLLFIGGFKVNKNIEGILKALNLLGGERKLVAVSDNNAAIRLLAEKYNIAGKLVCLESVAENDLPLLYNAADLFVSPSLYEGFGLPHLEAMACGTPVVAANASSLPEIVGDAGILVDPNVPEEIAAAMKKILGDEGLRQEMYNKGVARARLFRWDACARQTLAVCRQAGGVK